MVLPRSNALRSGCSAARLARSVPRTAVRSRVQTVARRGYASGHGGHDHAPSSDMPWLISAIAVTIPSCYFLWPEASHGDAHGAHGAHEEHEEHDEEASEEPKEEESTEDSKEEDAPKEEAAPAEESKEDESKGDESKKDDSEQKEAPKEGKPGKTEAESTSNKKVDGVQFKGKTGAGDDNNEMTDSRKREPDSKGAFKKRIDSHYAKDLGPGPSKSEDGRASAATAKPISGDPGAMDTKQKGLSATATRHSTAIHEDPEKSKKGEGVPETAKSMGTVDVNRPQAESPNRGEHK